MSHRRASPSVFSNARQLRHNQTEAETKLWRALRMGQLANVHFRRQHAIGNYIVDFCAPRHKLIIEVDGGQHQDQQVYDDERTAYLASKGFRVLRFWNNEVENQLDDVVKVILESLALNQ
jgi:very-short-patch-repair endonuclease